MNQKTVKRSILLLAGVLLAPPVAAHSLSQAIQLALSNNPEVLSAQQGVGVAKEQLTQSKAGWLPTVDLAVEVGNEYKDDQRVRATSLAKNLSSLTVTQPLFDGGATSAAVARSGEMKHISSVHLDEVRSSVTLEAIEAWYEVYRLQRVIKLTNSNLLEHKKNVAQVKQKVEAGGAGKAELAAAETPWIAAKNALINAQGDYKDAIAKYVTVVGIAPDSDLRDALGVTEALLPATVGEALALLLQNNYVLETARANLAAAKADHHGARSGLLPTLDFELKGGRKENDGGSIAIKQDYTALLKLNYNLFNGGSDLSYRRETARAMMDSQEQLALAQRNMEEQLHQFWNGLDVSRKLLQTSQQQLVIAQDNFESAKEQFKLGEGDVMAIIAADDALLQARKSVLEDKIDTQLGVYRILSHIGTLLNHLDVAPVQLEDEVLQGLDSDLMLVDRVLNGIDEVIAGDLSSPFFAVDEVAVVETDPLNGQSLEVVAMQDTVAVVEVEQPVEEGYATMKESGWVVMNTLSETKQAADARALREAQAMAEAKREEALRIEAEAAQKIADRKAEDRARAQALAYAAKVDRIKRVAAYPKARAERRKQALNGRLAQYSQRMAHYKQQLGRSNEVLNKRRSELRKMLRGHNQRLASRNMQSIEHMKRKELSKVALSKRGVVQEGVASRTKQQLYQSLMQKQNRKYVRSARAIHQLNRAAAQEKAQQVAPSEARSDVQLAQQNSMNDLFDFLNPGSD